MKKFLMILAFLLFPTSVFAEGIYHSILRDNEVKQLPTDYNIFTCITVNEYWGEGENDHSNDGTCIIGEGADADYVEGYTQELVGLYPFKDDKGSVYFFRGWADNWVQLGSYQDDYYYYFIEDINNYKVGNHESCLEESSDPSKYCEGTVYKIASKGDLMYWRIIRTNGDKSVRLVYAGTQIDTYADKLNIGASAFNMVQDEYKYAGYTYTKNGVRVDSAIKTYVENWYQLNNQTLKKYVVPSTFVNDTSTLYQHCYGNGDEDLCWPGYARLYFWSEENEYDISPSLMKSNSTADYGGDYTLDVGIVSGDEMVMAGGSMWGYYTADSINMKYNMSEDWEQYDDRISISDTWSMTPGDSYITRYNANTDDPFGSNSRRQVEMVATNMCMYTNDVTSYYSVKPVISISGDVEMEGHGTVENPYHLAEKTNITLQLEDYSKDLKEYFKDFSDTDEVEWVIADESILEIIDNKIYAKKIGETDVSATVGGISYSIHVKVTSVPIINPNTGRNVFMIFLLFVFSIGLGLFMRNEIKRTN